MAAETDASIASSSSRAGIKTETAGGPLPPSAGAGARNTRRFARSTRAGTSAIIRETKARIEKSEIIRSCSGHRRIRAEARRAGCRRRPATSPMLRVKGRPAESGPDPPPDIINAADPGCPPEQGQEGIRIAAPRFGRQGVELSSSDRAIVAVHSRGERMSPDSISIGRPNRIRTSGHRSIQNGYSMAIGKTIASDEPMGQVPDTRPQDHRPLACVDELALGRQPEDRLGT